MRPLQKYELAAIRSRLLDRSQGWYRLGFPAELEGGSAPRPGLIGLADSIVMSKPTRPFAGKTSRDDTPHSAIIAPLSVAVQPADSSPQPEVKTPPSGLPKKPVNGSLSFLEHRGEELGMRRPRARTNRSGSTELIATLISRTPIRTDGTYVLYLHDPKQQL